MYVLDAARRRRLAIALLELVLVVALWAAMLGAHALFARDFTYHELCRAPVHTAVVDGKPDHGMRSSGGQAGAPPRLACVVPLPSPAPRPQSTEEEVPS